MWRELSRSSKIPGSSSSLLFFDGETWAHRLLPPFWWYLQTDKNSVWSYPDKLRIADSDFFMLDQRNQVYALIAMVAYCQIVDFPTWPRMTGWHGGCLGTCLPPRHKCHGLARASKKACRGQRWFGHVCNSFTVSSRSAFSMYLTETNTVHFTSIEILGRPVCKGIVPLENFFCLNASYFRQ